jgi:predicted RNA-binding Zn-ribbon protein involved in translation (DUF1610 family)
MEADKNLAAVCGLYCRACTLYIGTTEDPARLESIAARMGRTIEEVKCGGCRAERRSFYCRTCRIEACAAAQGLEFCGDCAQYPCELLKIFQGERPHRAELWRDLARIRAAGWAKWLEEKAGDYSCPACGTVNSAYDLACRRCGREPSCRFVAGHREEIERYWAGQK